MMEHASTYSFDNLKWVAAIALLIGWLYAAIVKLQIRGFTLMGALFLVFGCAGALKTFDATYRIPAIVYSTSKDLGISQAPDE
jgi:hypothetical protein